MESNSRFAYALKNLSIGAIMQIIILFLSFVSRTIFVNLLGNEYLSCDGLFTNILTVLSFSELGIGSAIVYSLYEPIAKGDKNKIGRIMNLFSKSYTIVPIIIMALGLCLIPFLNNLVDTTTFKVMDENIVLIYVLFLVNSASSYINGYAGLYLMACQKNYITLVIQQLINIIRIILQTIVLYITHNYILFLVITILGTIFTNFFITQYTYKLYPWLKEVKKNSIKSSERSKIVANILSIFRYQIGSVVLNGTDNIIITKYLNINMVGLCSNYTLVINSLYSILSKACNGLIATIGNYNLNASKSDNHKMFNILYFLSFFVFSYCTIMLLCLINPFISIWLGKEYELSFIVVISLILSFYTLTINTIPSSFRTTMGYFKETQNFPIIAAIINIILSIFLANNYGLSGVFFATSIARMFTYNVSDAYFVFKKGFKISPINYYITFMCYTLYLFVCGIFIYKVTSLIVPINLVGLVFKFLCCTILFIIIFVLSFCQTFIFKETMRIILLKVKKL